MAQCRLTKAGGAPLVCECCGKWLCGDPRPARYMSLETLTYGWIYCSPECVDKHEKELTQWLSKSVTE